MKKITLYICLFAFALSIFSFAKDQKPANPTKDIKVEKQQCQKPGVGNWFKSLFKAKEVTPDQKVQNE